MRPIFIIFQLLILNILLFATASAQPNKNAQVGDIDVQAGITENPYETSQAQSIDFFTKFRESLEKNSLNALNTTLNENHLNYLNGVYLYCTVNSGVCPYILEAIYEVDFLKSKSSGDASCPLMTQFWKLWIKNELESRQSYLVKTSNITATSEFTTKVRPRYIKCLDTIKQDLTSNKAVAQDSVNKTLQLLNALKEKKVNVFIAMGALPKVDEDNDDEKPPESNPIRK